MILKTGFSLFLFLLASLITWLSYQKSRHQQFYSDTFILIPLGVFVWGDGLILGPFWLISSLLFYFFTKQQIWHYWLLFWVIRSSYEVIYWLNHQAANKTYKPPLFRKIAWLDAGQSAILYQLLNMSVVILGLVGLWWS
ncbi:MAG: hypothetical protein GF390_03170 [Candidatus Pacebacteria bacterium]|nr:hypothetical protein [Candidatus Paceibacterota bacterium]